MFIYFLFTLGKPTNTTKFKNCVHYKKYIYKNILITSNIKNIIYIYIYLFFRTRDLWLVDPSSDDRDYCFILIFISAVLSEYRKPFQLFQLTPRENSAVRPPRYSPLRLDEWQALYHQAPWNILAQLPEYPSRSLSLVEKGRLLWSLIESP